MSLIVRNLPANAGDIRNKGLIPGSVKSPGSRHGKSTPVFLPEESHGRWRLEGYSAQGHKEMDTIEAI